MAVFEKAFKFFHRAKYCVKYDPVCTLLVIKMPILTRQFIFCVRHFDFLSEFDTRNENVFINNFNLRVQILYVQKLVHENLITS
jgi:hypothetical protein